MSLLSEIGMRLTAVCFVAGAVGMEISYAAPADPCLPRAELTKYETGNIVDVSSVSELHAAIGGLRDNTTIRLEAGTYALNETLYIGRNNVTIIGSGSHCGDVRLVGSGMDNPNNSGVVHGVWTNAGSLKVVNLTIRDVFEHGVIINGSGDSPLIDSVHFINTGTQFIKANPQSYGVGVDNGVVQNSLFMYEQSPPTYDHGIGTGYTNGVDVHAGDGWVIRNNVFMNMHTPDSADFLWNPAVLMWNGASNTIVENNVFVDVDRAVAFGLGNRQGGPDHSNGIVRNNMIYYSSGLYSSSRSSSSDAAILVWDSPGSQVLHNTVITNGNINSAIEMRFETSGVQIVNNLTDARISSRAGEPFYSSSNFVNAARELFVNPDDGNLRIKSTALDVIDKADRAAGAEFDVDGEQRPAHLVDIGADELSSISPPMPPGNIDAVPR